MDKLKNFTGGLSWGFVEGFPLTGANCKKNMQLIQQFMVEHTRLGIPVFTVAESLHGSVHEGSTIYPQNIALGSTFRPDLAYRKAAMITKDLHAQGIHQVLAPCIDVVRDCGGDAWKSPSAKTLYYVDSLASPKSKDIWTTASPPC